MRCLVTAFLTTGAVLLWQSLTVHYNYDGNWTALFCTGANFRQPPELEAENIYRFSKSDGFDGQFYHYVAHDPFLQHGFAQYIDLPRLRYRRILVPLAAHVLAVGRSEFVDYAYVAVVLGFVFLGSYWLGAFLSLNGFSAAWGWAFALTPGVLISIDRLTVDIALVALSVAFALYLARGAQVQLFATLVAAPLVRETGLLLVAGHVLYLLLQRSWRRALIFSTAVTPAAAWYAYVELHTSAERLSWFQSVPLSGLASRLIHPVQYPLPPFAALTATVLDYVALAGMLLAIVIGYAAIRRLKAGPVESILLLFGLLATLLEGRHLWINSYDFGRSLAPLPLLAALEGLRRRKWLNLLPVLLIIPRVALQLVPQAIGIMRGLAGLGR